MEVNILFARLSTEEANGIFVIYVSVSNNYFMTQPMQDGGHVMISSKRTEVFVIFWINQLEKISVTMWIFCIF
jgi:hypothetical protein